LLTKSIFNLIGPIMLSFGLVTILASIHSQQSPVLAQTAASVSIVKGASSPSITKPYDPSPLRIKSGTSVTWTNKDSTLHTVTSGLPEQGAVGTLFDSSILAPAKTYTHAFNKAGTFDYSCTLHPFMRGQVVVK
jgi:nitrite reductase (NO-forming)